MKLVCQKCQLEYEPSDTEIEGKERWAPNAPNICSNCQVKSFPENYVSHPTPVSAKWFYLARILGLLILLKVCWDVLSGHASVQHMFIFDLEGIPDDVVLTILGLFLLFMPESSRVKK